MNFARKKINKEEIAFKITVIIYLLIIALEILGCVWLINKIL